MNQNNNQEGLGTGRPSAKNLQEFATEASKLGGAEFVGLSITLGVPLVSKDNEALPFEEVFSNILDQYIKIPRRKRREIMKYVKLSVPSGFSQIKENN